MQPGEQPNYTLVKIRFWAKTWIWIKSRTFKKNLWKKIYVSSRSYETFKMIACSLSSTGQNMLTYLNLAFIEIKRLFFSFMNFFSVCVHENALFALHAQMVSSIQNPFQWMHVCTFKYKIEIIMTKFTFEIAFVLLSMNWNNVTILDSFWWQILHSSGFLPSRTLVWNT